MLQDLRIKHCEAAAVINVCWEPSSSRMLKVASTVPCFISAVAVFSKTGLHTGVSVTWVAGFGAAVGAAATCLLLSGVGLRSLESGHIDV